MKRILIFSLAYLPHVGGAEVALKEITDRIPDIEFHMVTLRFSQSEKSEEKIGNVFVHRIGNGASSFSKFLFQFTAARRASKLHKLQSFDAIWAMMAHSCGVPAGIFKTFNPKVKYLLTLQEGDPPEYIERIMWPVWPLFKRGFTKADELQAISNFLLAWGKRMGFRGEGVVIPNGVDILRFSNVQHLAPSSTTTLVTTSRLVHKNGVDVIIRALSHLPETIQLVIYGSGPDEEMLKKLAAKTGVAARVRFAGEIAHSDLQRALAESDVFVRPSRSEGMGISFIEAMAAGLPVIATQEGGIADFLFDAKRNPNKETTGWAVDKDSPEQISEAVKNIFAHPEQVAKVTETAKKMVRDKYDWNIIAQQMKKLFDRLLGNR